MSATGRNKEGHERRADDFYSTPAWCTRAILPHLTPGSVLDPCCGEGAILDVVTSDWKHATFGIELDASRSKEASSMARISKASGGEHTPRSVGTGDALSPIVRWPYASQIITNPPYSLAEELIRRALTTERDAAFLLRINFLGSQRRAQFHREHPCDLFPLPRRPGFVLALSCQKKNGGCGWGDMFPIDPVTERADSAPHACPVCGNEKLSRSSSDATEYAWMVWGPGRGNRWAMLDVEEPGRAKRLTSAAARTIGLPGVE